MDYIQFDKLIGKYMVIIDGEWYTTTETYEQACEILTYMTCGKDQPCDI